MLVETENLLYNKKMRLLFLIAGFYFFSTFAFSQEKYVEITNSSAVTLQDLTIELPVKDLKLPIGNYESLVEGQLPAPLEITSGVNGDQFAVIPVPKIETGKTIKIQIRPGVGAAYPKRTFAELSHKEGKPFTPGVDKRYDSAFYWVKPNLMKLPGTFKNHSYYMKSEGPVWENDRVCFRLYLDDRNKIDVNGKKTSSIVMPTVGAADFEEEHKMSLWGMDNTKVGKALGLGSFGSWTGTKVRCVDTRDSTFCSIIADGKVCSQVKTIYYGWENEQGKSTLTSLISLNAGSRASKVELLLENPVIQLATGIIKDKEGEYITADKTNGDWTYIATFGKQSVNKDMQGFALFFRKSQLDKITEDELNHVVVFKKGSKQIEYYIMPTWELDKKPVVTKQDFMNCIAEVMNRLNNPLKIKIK